MAVIRGLGIVFWLALAIGCATINPLAELTPKQRGELLLQSAKQGNRNRVDALLVENTDVNYTNTKGQSALSIAVKYGRFPVVKALISAGADLNHEINGKTLLMRAVAQNNLLMTQVLVASGADLHIISDQGETALAIARKNRHSDLEMLLVQAEAAR